MKTYYIQVKNDRTIYFGDGIAYIRILEGFLIKAILRAIMLLETIYKVESHG